LTCVAAAVVVVLVLICSHFVSGSCPSVTRFDPNLEPNSSTPTCFCDPAGIDGRSVEIQCFYGSTIANLSQAIVAVKNSGKQVTSVVMNNMDFPDNEPFNITRRSLAGVETTLRNLSIVACVLLRVPEAIQALHSLNALELQHNKISAITRKDLETVAKTLRHLDISENVLTTIENGTLDMMPGLETLILSNNHLNDSVVVHLKELISLADGEGIFSSLDRLEVLDLSKNKIGNISRTMFAPLPSLSFLDLNLNMIEDIDDGSFAGMPNITKLKIEGTYLDNLRPNMFVNLSNLEYLQLGWNELKTIPEGAFTHTPNLKVLSLNSNGLLQTLDPSALKNLKQLEILNLSYTSVVTIEPLLFNGTKLKVLDLSSGELERLPADAFDFTPDLETLFVNNTKLISLPDTIFDRLKRLQEINLSYNQWLCDTTLGWLSSWLRNSAAIVQNRNYVSCEWPIRLRGISVASLNDSEFVDYEYDDNGGQQQNETLTSETAVALPEAAGHADSDGGGHKPCNIGGHVHANDQSVEMGTIITIVVVILVVSILVVLTVIVLVMKRRRRQKERDTNAPNSHLPNR
ncbi:unnamed protein product, partial [Soboliphyme baturini]|uniref:LRRCT domain-containing protein n=1 Tax=Soboliphyme baturini TaxID=241478 RepID=A0A183IDB0_9BILA